MQQPAPHRVLRGCQLRRRRDVLARDDEDVHRRLRVDVAERDDVVVLVHLGRGQVAGGDRAEEAVAHGCSRVARTTSPSTPAPRTRSTPPRRVPASSQRTARYVAVRPWATPPSTLSHTTSCSRPTARARRAAPVRCAARRTSALRRWATSLSTWP